MPSINGNTKKEDEENKNLMEQLDPQLVHRILLSSLSSSGDDDDSLSSLLKKSTIDIVNTFIEFRNNILPSNNNNNNNNPAFVIKRAYHDHLYNHIKNQNNNSIQLLYRMLIQELYPAIGNLIIKSQKNKQKKDNDPLRFLLSKEEQQHYYQFFSQNNDSNSNSGNSNNHIDTFISLLIRSGQSLIELESPIRSESTNDWMTLARKQQQRQQQNRVATSAPSADDAADDTVANTEDIVDGDNNNEDDGTTTAAATTNNNDNTPSSLLSFTILSLLYLIDKTDLCAQEISEFYFNNIIVPYIQNNADCGRNIVRSDFQKRYPYVSNDDHYSTSAATATASLPITKEWIRSLLLSEQDVEDFEDKLHKLQNSSEERRKFITKGWINTILFHQQQKQQQTEVIGRERENANNDDDNDPSSNNSIENVVVQQNPKQQQVLLPEIFCWDVSNLQNIRNITRTAASGCALGWHASKAVNCDPETILQQEAKYAQPLLTAMGNHRNHGSVGKYEESIEDAVILLARYCYNNHNLNNNNNNDDDDNDDKIDTDIENLLRGQTRAVLQGKDAVMKLLDDRTRHLFVELIELVKEDNRSEQQQQQQQLVPPVLRSGRQQVQQNKTKESSSSYYLTKATQHFKERGLSFYAIQLAKTSELAQNIAHLAYELYADEFLDTMILGCINAYNINNQKN